MVRQKKAEQFSAEPGLATGEPVEVAGVETVQGGTKVASQDGFENRIIKIDPDVFSGRLNEEIAAGEAKDSGLRPSVAIAADVLMTVSELAAFAGVSESKIYHDLESGVLIPHLRWGPKPRHGKSMLRFLKPEIVAWMRECAGRGGAAMESAPIAPTQAMADGGSSQGPRRKERVK
jgi:predicted DNA-binding transcriptional regulator AlpA